MKKKLYLIVLAIAVVSGSPRLVAAAPYVVVMNDWADAKASYYLDSGHRDAVNYAGPAQFGVAVSGSAITVPHGWWLADGHVRVGPNVWTPHMAGAGVVGVFGVDVLVADEGGAVLASASVATAWLFRVGNEDVPFVIDLGSYGSGLLTSYDIPGKQWVPVIEDGAWHGPQVGVLVADQWYRLTASYDQGNVDDRGFAGMAVRGNVIFDEGRTHVADPIVPFYALPEASTVALVLAGAAVLLGRRWR